MKSLMPISMNLLSRPACTALATSLLLLAGCATTRPATTASATGNDPKTLSEVLQQDAKGGSPSGDGLAKTIAVGENGDIIIQGVKLKNTQFDFPITIN